MKKTYGSFQSFWEQNRRLLVFLALLLAGVVGGVVIFRRAASAPAVLASFFPQGVEATPGGLAAAWLRACLPVWLVLGVLFLTGLAVWGAPVAAAAPVFFGLGIGLGEAVCAARGADGLAMAALLILPGRLAAAAAVLPGCAESLRFSLQLARQTVRRDARGGGLLREGRLYCVRFIVFFGMAAAAGAVDVLFRLLFGPLFAA
ncbi:MAG: hypothetical protein IKI50_01255 [Clostridia bacterium]|nr:hypothetical protein [Clostridia bacterium]